MKRKIAKFRVGLILAGLTLVAAHASAAGIVYVDATDGAGANTTLVGGAQWGPLTLDVQGAASDGIWDKRGFGAGPTVYQNSRSGTVDNAHRLETTVPVAAGTYNDYAYFWDDGSSPWRMAASLTDNPGGDLPLYIGGGAPSGTPTPTQALAASFMSPPTGGIVTNGSGQLVDSANRRMWQISLGQQTGTSIKVFVDDDPAQPDQNARTWYDGVGYERVPEPTSFALLGFGLGMLFIGRRKAGR
jgi:hypothetical protein